MKKYAISSNIRERIYTIIFITSIFLSAVITVLFNALVKDFAADNFWVLFFNILILPTMGGINVLLKWLFNNHIWKVTSIYKFTKVPNLAGDWAIEGKNSNDFVYTGTLHIQQTFDKILVKGVFENSKSFNEETYFSFKEDEVVLSYYYLNEPKQKGTNFNIHHGFAKIVFDSTINTAEGKYFNDDFRETKGIWKLKKK